MNAVAKRAAHEVQGGQWDGRAIRRARKEHRCDNWQHCKNKGVIAAGDFYVESEVDPDHAGGFGMKKLCSACVDAPASLSIAQVALKSQPPGPWQMVADQTTSGDLYTVSRVANGRRVHLQYASDGRPMLYCRDSAIASIAKANGSDE